MKTRRSFNRSFLALLALATSSSSLVWAQEAAKPGARHAAAALDLFHQLRGDAGNLFFSPYSVSAAFGMVGAGTKDNTAAEIAGAFHFGTMDAAFHQQFGELHRALMANGNKDGDLLAIANALCVTGGSSSQDYLKLIKTIYDAEIFPGKVDTINAWAKQKTHGKIDSILKTLNPNSLLVLLNAVYFKGSWKNAFHEKATQEKEFHLSAEKSERVPMMRQKSDFRMLNQEVWQAIDLPYATGLSMTILLPKERHGLAAAEAKLDAAGLAAILNALDQSRTMQVNLSLPKFKLSAEYDLIDPLKKSGIKDAFIPEAADFTPMGFDKGVAAITQVRHRAVIEVGEKGTEAAAVTAVEISTRSAPRQTPNFIADHPFLFLIRDQASGTILFMGRLNNPQAE